MRKALVWAGDAVGGFGAAFLVYVVIGVLAGLALARPYTYPSPRDCWPADRFFIAADCENAFAGALWYGAVELPLALVASPAIALYLLTTPPIENLDAHGSYAVVDTAAVAVGTCVVMLLSLIGFLAWHTRSAIVAWLLVVALAGEIAVVGNFA